jgi:hypothetical protein
MQEERVNLKSQWDQDEAVKPKEAWPRNGISQDTADRVVKCLHQLELDLQHDPGAAAVLEKYACLQRPSDLLLWLKNAGEALVLLEKTSGNTPLPATSFDHLPKIKKADYKNVAGIYGIYLFYQIVSIRLANNQSLDVVRVYIGQGSGKFTAISPEFGDHHPLMAWGIAQRWDNGHYPSFKTTVATGETKRTDNQDSDVPASKRRDFGGPVPGRLVRDLRSRCSSRQQQGGQRCRSSDQAPLYEQRGTEG